MTVDLLTIGLGLALALIYLVLPASRRQFFLFLTGLIALFWLQPPLPIRWSGFILPGLTVLLTTGSWWLTRPAAKQRPSREDWTTLALIGAVILLLSLVRYLPPDWRPTLNRPPAVWQVGLILGLLGGGFWGLTKIGRRRPLLVGAAVLVILFIFLKNQFLGAALSGWWRSLTGQNPELAAAVDLSWLGFSYIAFRLLHTIRERQTGQLPDLSLRSYLSYVTFFPALIAGPIDRAERFDGDWRALPDLTAADPDRWLEGMTRIGRGLFRKFIIADSLAFGFSLTADNALQVESAGWLWLLLYGYALRLYFDFAGYSDIAIGLGILFGIRLPENFDRPYLSSDLTTFWKRWHISLSDWARFYIFTPLSRSLLRRKPRPSTTLIVLIGHLATMLMIGLWHGITPNFAIWGLWHAAGLFIHKQWSDRTRPLFRQVQQRPWQRRLWSGAGWLLTFHYVVLGWVWFLLPDVDTAWQVFGRLGGGA